MRVKSSQDTDEQVRGRDCRPSGVRAPRRSCNVRTLAPGLARDPEPTTPSAGRRVGLRGRDLDRDLGADLLDPASLLARQPVPVVVVPRLLTSRVSLPYTRDSHASAALYA